jgi:hypothetical protein
VSQKNDTPRISFNNLILDLCGLLSGGTVPHGDGDDEEREKSPEDQTGKGKKIANNKKRKEKKSVVEIIENPGGEGQFRDLVNSINYH